MTIQNNLASLLNAHMKRASVGDARLANQVNSINGNSFFIHRSTLRNWRTGSAQKVNNWRQLATVAVAVQPTELNASAGDIEGNYHQLSNAGEIKNQTKSSVLPEIKAWEFIAAKRNLVACMLMVFGFFSLGYYQYQSHESNMLVNSHFDKGGLGWISYVNDEADASFKVDDGALHIQINQRAKKSWHIGLNQKDLEVIAGKFYTARFRVRGDGVASMYVDITRVIDPKTSLNFDNSQRQKVTTTNNWVTRTIEFEAIETITAKDGGARLFFRFGKSEKGTIVLDDIEFFEGKLEQHVAATQL